MDGRKINSYTLKQAYVNMPCASSFHINNHFNSSIQVYSEIKLDFGPVKLDN